MNIKTMTFPIHGDERGSLIAIEGSKDIPFSIKRVYYIFGTQKNAQRGFHSHKKLQQVLIAVSGSCKILCDDGHKKEIFKLKTPQAGLYIGPGIWREMFDFSSNCVLIVFASELYTENDYIRNYDFFLQSVNK